MTIALRNRQVKRAGQKNARKRRRRGGKNWLTLLLAGLLLYFGYSSFGQLKLMIELRNEFTQVEQDIEAAEKRAKEIKDEIAYLKSDAYLEKIARQELGLVKPGEIIFMPENSLDTKDQTY